VDFLKLLRVIMRAYIKTINIHWINRGSNYFDLEKRRGRGTFYLTRLSFWGIWDDLQWLIRKIKMVLAWYLSITSQITMGGGGGGLLYKRVMPIILWTHRNWISPFFTIWKFPDFLKMCQKMVDFFQLLSNTMKANLKTINIHWMITETE